LNVPAVFVPCSILPQFQPLIAPIIANCGIVAISLAIPTSPAPSV